MSKVKCIIRQEWENRDAEGWIIERSGYVYVTNEDGTPHVYDSIKEARNEIYGNFGRDANKSGILHTHSVDEYSGHVHDGYIYIVREDTEEFAAATATTEPEATEAEAVTIYATEPTETEAAPVIELHEWEKVLVQVEPNTIYDTITSEPHTYGYRATVCIISEFGNLSIYPGLSTTGKTIKTCKRAANRVLKIRYGLQMSGAVAQGSTLEAMHASITDETVHEHFKQWCADMFANEAEERAAVETVAPAVVEEYGTSEDAVAAMAYEAYAAMHDGARPYQVHEVREFDRLMKYAAEIAETAAARKQSAGDPLAKYRDLEYLEFDEPRPTYQRAELEAYVGAENLGSYDLEAIEAEATAYDPATSRTVWTAGPEELATICQRHELATA